MISTLKKVFYLSLTPCLIWGALPVISALALSSGGVGGYPANPDPGVPFSESWFIYNLDLGESKQDAVLVFNTTDEVKAVKLYAVDSTPSNQGNFALKGEDDPRVGIGAWIELSEEVIILEPGQSKEVAFTITIPEDADVGEHSGGIILQKADPSNVDAETGASIVTRVGIRVYQTVPGEITKDIELKDFSVEEIFSPTEGPMYEINVTAKNNGNVTLTPKARLEVTGWGKIDYKDIEDISVKKFKQFISGEAEFPIQFFSGETLKRDWQLLRDQEVTTRWTWPKPQFGRFSFQVVLEYDGNTGPEVLQTEKISVWVVPGVELSILTALFVLAIFLIILRKFIYSGKGWNSYVVQKNDQLLVIAKRANVNWKKLAKVNKLKKPYSL